MMIAVAIWNTNAFFAYLISVKLFKLEWESRRLFAVLLATLGVIVVVYGGSTSLGDDTASVTGSGFVSMRSFKPSAPLVGNLLTLIASFGYGLYQVLYKIYVALPSDPEVTSDILYERILDEQTDVGHYNVPNEVTADHSLFPPPFGLHPNLLTSAVGLTTLLLLWMPIPILNATGTETFRLPPNGMTVLTIGGIALSGVVFNAGFMVSLTI
jgi:drug/metabolite transporter (DMT)-like permease